MGWMFDNVGRLIARLQKPADNCEPFTPNDSMALRDALRPGDVLLVEGKGRILGSMRRNRQRAPRPDRSHYRRRCGVGTAVKISGIAKPESAGRWA